MNTSYKTPKEIEIVRKLKRKQMSLKAISRQVGFSINTVRKIVRRTNGYEGHEFDSSRFRGRKLGNTNFVSDIDGERLCTQKTHHRGVYPRVTAGRKNRIHLHIHEAKKAYRIARLRWPSKAVVHHVDDNPGNASQNNLVVFKCTGDHLSFHRETEKSMRVFLSRKGLLKEFYESHPEVNPKTLAVVMSEKKEKHEKTTQQGSDSNDERNERGASDERNEREDSLTIQ